MLYHKTYELGPEWPWVVFVHGAGGSSSLWFRQLKAYREHFNVLLLDLRGHGQSHRLQQVVQGKYSFRDVTEDIVRLLDHLGIRRAHFVGMSLGTILIRHLAELCPERVCSMVLGGAILRLDIRSRVLVQLGRLGQHFLPYMWLYRLFAFIIMPRKRHQESRLLFVREARKLCQKEFKRWFRLATEVNPLMRYFRERPVGIPTLYIMGEEDYLFLSPVREQVARDPHSTLAVIDGCGHVCNVEHPELFNRQSLAFLSIQRDGATQTK
ncbi:alpha/beta fold hydrolase [Aeromonas simiae]|uniref:alpha/beta fold hydrolase n=1 Tax=Aeromonas simiae TaxID=218936 RepID=UPI0005A7AAA0|nr:alpha/beta hydrolase [Aeromonas simiae]MDO2950939.1 alpha/beta hydrolase [Aeromonas simiae]